MFKIIQNQETVHCQRQADGVTDPAQIGTRNCRLEFLREDQRHVHERAANQGKPQGP